MVAESSPASPAAPVNLADPCATEYGYLDENDHICLDHADADLPAQGQRILPEQCITSDCYRAPHSKMPAFAASTESAVRTGRAVLRHFSVGRTGASVFVPDATGALRLVGQACPLRRGRSALPHCSAPPPSRQPARPCRGASRLHGRQMVQVLRLSTGVGCLTVRREALARVLYAIPHLHSVQRAVRLDLPTGSLMRSPETTTSHVLECALDELSYALHLDPVDLRLRNDTHVNPDTGQPYGSRHLKECLSRGAQLFGWSRRDPTPRAMRDDDGFIGWGVAAAAHTTGSLAGASARVTLSTDGTALVQCGTQDIGTGTYTVMTQVSADSLGLPLRSVRFELGDTSFPPAPGSAASRTIPTTVPAVASACGAARDAVIQLAVNDPASPLYGIGTEHITADNGELYVTDSGTPRDSYRAVLSRHGSPVVINGRPGTGQRGYNTGAVFVEVHVQPRLGTVRVRRVVGVYDPGTVLNHRTARSQVIGGVIWNIGFTLTEQTLIDADAGRIVNPNLSGYLVPVNADVPHIQVEFIDRPDPTSAALGARGFGEIPSTGVTAALANAVYHATGRRIRDLPLSRDKLL